MRFNCKIPQISSLFTLLYVVNDSLVVDRSYWGVYAENADGHLLLIRFSQKIEEDSNFAGHVFSSFSRVLSGPSL